MKSNECGGWRVAVFWMGVAVAALITGFVLGWLWRDRPGVLADVRILDVLIAVGTISAAAGAFYAAKVAIDAGLAESQRREDERKRKSEFLLSSISYELRALDGALGNLVVTLDMSNRAAKRASERGKQSSFTMNAVDTVAACARILSTPTLDRFWADLKDIENGLGVDAVFIIAETKRLSNWLSWLPDRVSAMESGDATSSHSEICAASAAKIGISVCRILREINPGKSDKIYRDFIQKSEVPNLLNPQ